MIRRKRVKFINIPICFIVHVMIIAMIQKLYILKCSFATHQHHHNNKIRCNKQFWFHIIDEDQFFSISTVHKISYFPHSKIVIVCGATVKWQWNEMVGYGLYVIQRGQYSIFLRFRC